jgi:hypothetical protein
MSVALTCVQITMYAQISAADTASTTKAAVRDGLTAQQRSAVCGQRSSCDRPVTGALG